MKGGMGLGKHARKNREAEAAEKAAAEKATASLNNNSNFPYRLNTGISKLNLEIIMDIDDDIIKNGASKNSLIDAVVNLVDVMTKEYDVRLQKNNELKKKISNIMKKINEKYKSNFAIHDMYEVIFSNGGTFSDTDFTTLVHNIYPKLETKINGENITGNTIVNALDEKLQHEVAKRTGIHPNLGNKPPLLRQNAIGTIGNLEKSGGKRRTKRRRQRSNKKRTNKRKKTKTRMKKRKTHKRKTIKRRRKR